MILYWRCVQVPIFTINEHPQSTCARYGQTQDKADGKAAREARSPTNGKPAAVDGKPHTNGKAASIDGKLPAIAAPRLPTANRWTTTSTQSLAPLRRTAMAPTGRRHPLGARAANANTTAR